MPRTPGSHRKRSPVKTARQRVWNAMHVYDDFISIDMELSAEINERNLRAYLYALYRAGYLRLVRPRQDGENFGYAIWRLVEDTGPLAPIVRRDQSGVYDPNLDQFIPFQEKPEPVKKERIHDRVFATLSAPDPIPGDDADPAVEEIAHARRR